MLTTRPLHKIGIVFCVALFAVGTARLFWLRFEAGDLYPAYSSLRSDPLGLQALYESLRDLDGQEISRNFRPLDEIELTPGSTLALCGLTDIPQAADAPWETILDKATAGGGRLLVSLSSASSVREEEKEEEKNDETGAEDAGTTTEEDTGKKNSKEDGPEQTPPQAPTLGVTLRSRTLGDDHGNHAVRQSRKTDALPETLFFHSPLFFETEDPAWETVFFFENEPVVIRRSWGEGDVVLMADSYIFSNEALRNHRAPDFLAWTVRNGPVVFDEYHHGLARQPGIAALIRKYRLHGVVLSLAVVVALLIWQRAVVFTPRPADNNDDREDTFGTDAAGGWASLMRRHIAPGDLLGVCLEAWETSAAADRYSKEQLGEVRNMISRRGEDSVTVYQSICKLLKRGKTS